MSSRLLFEDKVRTRLEPMRQGEGAYKFVDESAWESCAAYRTLLNGWLSNYPESEQREMIARLSRGSDDAFYAALAELIVREALRKCCSAIIHHPHVPATKNKPDFKLETRDGNTLAFVEVTSYGIDGTKLGKGAQASTIFNAINDMRLPAGYVLGYQLVREGTSSPPLKPLVKRVRAWVDAKRSEAWREPPEELFTAGDWEVSLTLHRLSSGTVADRAIGVYSADARFIGPSSDLRRSLELKSSRYGELGAPYLIAVADRKGEMTWGEGIHDTVVSALFGDVCYRWQAGEADGTWVRNTNGFFGHDRRPRRAHVSAVLVLPQPDIWGLRNPNHQPILVRNPWASYSLPGEILPIQETTYSPVAGFARVDGKPLGDLLGLPEVWPPRSDAR